MSVTLRLGACQSAPAPTPRLCQRTDATAFPSRCGHRRKVALGLGRARRHHAQQPPGGQRHYRKLVCLLPPELQGVNRRNRHSLILRQLSRTCVVINTAGCTRFDRTRAAVSHIKDQSVRQMPWHGLLDTIIWPLI